MGWLSFSAYLLLAPASSISENGFFKRLLGQLGLKEMTKDLPVDKGVHFIIFMVLVLLWQRTLSALPLSENKKGRWILLNIGFWCAIGIATEYLQEFMQLGRQFDYTDMIANAAGCILGGWLAKKLTPVETGVATKTNCL
jgi:VanZ family protein